MHVFSLEREQEWNPKHHVEKILGKEADGDFTVACWIRHRRRRFRKLSGTAKCVVGPAGLEPATRPL